MRSPSPGVSRVILTARDSGADLGLPIINARLSTANERIPLRGARAFGRGERAFSPSERPVGVSERGFGLSERGFGRSERGFESVERGLGLSERAFERSARVVVVEPFPLANDVRTFRHGFAGQFFAAPSLFRREPFRRDCSVLGRGHAHFFWSTNLLARIIPSMRLSAEVPTAGSRRRRRGQSPEGV